MIVSTMNRMARGMDYPAMVGQPGSAISLVGAVEAPGTQTQWDSYGMNGCAGCGGGLGSVFSDITSLNFAALPGDIITGLNPATLDIGSYVIVGGLLWLLFSGAKFGGNKSAARRTSRKAKLVGQVAQDQALLKAS